MGKFIEYLFWSIVLSPVIALIIIWYLLKLLWHFFGITIVAALIISDFNPEMSTSKVIYYAGGISLIIGLYNRLKK